MNSSQHFDVLVFGAHPDDAEMAMGGTMIRLVDQGFSLKQVILTPADMSTYGTPQSRVSEFKAACAAVGCSGEILDYKDTGVENTQEVRLRLARIIRQHTPAIVFAPFHSNPRGELGGVANVDHYTTGAAVRDAVKMARLEKTVPDVPKHTVKKLYFFMLPRDVLPTLYVDISDVMDRTMAAIRCYKSQMAINFIGNDIEHALQTRRAARGLDIGARFAEAFTTELPLILEPEQFFRL